MTIETTTARIVYTGSGTTGPFSVPFYFLEDNDLVVIKTTISDGTEETLTLTTDYTVSGAADEGGGSVTLTSSLSSLYKLTIIRDPDMLQGTDYPANDRFPAASHERVADKLTMLVQRARDLFNRSFRLSDGNVDTVDLEISENATARANKYLGFDSSGNLTLSQSLDVGAVIISSFMETVLDDTDAVAARTTLGAAATGANTFTGLQTFAAGADIASATTVDLTAATGNLVRITGTTATTGVTVNNGQVVLCYPTGAWPLTYHATNMPIKGGVDYTCAAGDTVIFSKDGNGTLHVDIVPVALHPAIVSQAVAEAGTDTTARLWTAERVGQAIAALGGSGITIGAFTAWTSGAYKDITGLPSGTKRFKVKPVAMSTNGTSIMIVQLGDSGGIDTSGYTGTVESGSARTSFSSGIMLTQSGLAAFSLDGELTFELADASTNTWTCSGVMSGNNSAGASYSISGAKALSGELTQFRVTTVGGSDTGDAGGFGYSVEV